VKRILAWIKQNLNLKRFFRFCVSGLTSSLAEILVFAFLASVHELNTFLANSVAIVLSMIIGYLMNRHYTFRHRRPHPSSFILFVLLNAWNVVFSSWLIDLVAPENPWYKILAKIFALLVCAAWNYIAYKQVIFRHYAQESGPDAQNDPPAAPPAAGA